MEIQFTTQIFKEGPTYVAHTRELDVSSCGGTSQRALKNLKEAVRLFLEEADKLGTLDQILKEAGFLKRNRKLARAISDVGMGEFRRQIEYKSLWNGEMLLFADRFFPSSKTCSCCGWKWEEMELSDRLFLCQNPQCTFFTVPQDRDRNASENLALVAEDYLASLR